MLMLSNNICKRHLLLNTLLTKFPRTEVLLETIVTKLHCNLLWQQLCIDSCLFLFYRILLVLCYDLNIIIIANVYAYCNIHVAFKF